MDALNTPIDLRCIFQAILMDWACIRESESGGKDGGGKEVTWGAPASWWDSTWPPRHTIQSRVTTVGLLSVCVCALLNWFPLWWQLQSGWHQCPPYHHPSFPSILDTHTPPSPLLTLQLIHTHTVLITGKMAATGVMFWVAVVVAVYIRKPSSYSSISPTLSVPLNRFLQIIFLIKALFLEKILWNDFRWRHLASLLPPFAWKLWFHEQFVTLST